MLKTLAAALRAAVLATAHDGTTSTRDLRVERPDGSTHWLQARWRACASWPT